MSAIIVNQRNSTCGSRISVDSQQRKFGCFNIVHKYKQGRGRGGINNDVRREHLISNTVICISVYIPFQFAFDFYLVCHFLFRIILYSHIRGKYVIPKYFGKISLVKSAVERYQIQTYLEPIRTYVLEVFAKIVNI